MTFSKRIILLLGVVISVFIFSTIANAQEMEKTVIISKKMTGVNSYSRIAAYVLSVTEHYNQDLNIDGRTFLFTAQNDKYDVLQDLFLVVGGNAQDVYNFTKWFLAFVDECKIEDLRVTNDEFGLTIKFLNWKIIGKRYSISNQSNEYHIFKKSDIEKIQKKLLEYCNKHNIEVDTSIEIGINPSLKMHSN